MKHLESLNFEQKEAVLHREGPLLILAGAGAGKTKVITHRILNMIKEGVVPREILAITFTNKSAKEMRDRVAKLLSEDKELNAPISFYERPFVSTFHSLGVHILKENARLIGLTRHFAIFDRNDSYRAVKEAIVEEGLDPKKFEPGRFLSALSKQKGDMITVEQYTERAGRDYFAKVLAGIWKRYEATLRKEQALDFDDLLLKTAILLRDNQSILERYQNQWKYVHIDEYQDTNRVQYFISKMLAAKSRNICVVGDVDQNIYSWRGADIRNIMDFEKDYPEARVIVLEQNYRSTQIILDSANTIIKKNKNRREKNLFTKNGEGDKISLFEGYDEVDEAHFVAAKAKELIKYGTSASEIAVLYRANFQSRALEEAFLSHTVPYQLLGTRFFERKEIKDAISYLRAALNPEGLSDIKRIINAPARGIGKVTLLKILSGKENELSGAVKEKIQNFRALLVNIKEKSEKEKPSDVIKYLIKGSGMEDAYKNGTEEDMERFENLQELVTLATKYDGMPLVQKIMHASTENDPVETMSGALEETTSGIEKLLEEAALQSDQDDLQTNKDAVKLMTVHASKGLEFEYVFITGLEENLFPHKRLSEESLSEDQQEEERRLFYVALTRAKKKLFLVFTGVRTIFGSKQINIPSEFLSDLEEKNIQYEESGGIYDDMRVEKEPSKTIYFD